MKDFADPHYFLWAATKKLSTVDVDRVRSNQHEIGGVASLHTHLVEIGALSESASEIGLTTAMVAVGYGADVLFASEVLKLYDSRRNNPDRPPEWRLYYPAGGDIESTIDTLVEDGDTLALATPDSGPDLLLVVASAGTAWAGIVERLFPVDPSPGNRFLEIDHEALAEAEDASTFLLVLEELGLAPAVDESLLDWVLQQPELEAGLAGLDSFPSTAQMAALAIRRLDGSEGAKSIDDRLLARLDAESQIFYAIESAIALPLFEACSTTAEYVNLAKSLTQRRASRRGRSFEIHLEEVFAEESLTFASQALLPSGDRVDFLFPSVEDYLDDDVDASVLFAANAKTTVRERWRQLAGEASRLPTIYLITLDPNLTESTVKQMDAAGVRPVIVDQVLQSFPHSIRSVSMSVADLVERVRATQPLVGVDDDGDFPDQ